MALTYGDRLNDLDDIKKYISTADDISINTKNVMREETELLLKRQKAIYNILVVVTVVSVLFTVKYARN
jgi:imidazole glycerol phosphate synthase subunit HisF